MRVRWITLLAVIAALWTPGIASAQSASCQFVLGFATLASAVPQVGQCGDDQSFAANGDAVQHTTGGLLVWRKADNWTAFTDGYRTWVSGPNGIQERLNTERFPWEQQQSAKATPPMWCCVDASKVVLGASDVPPGYTPGSAIDITNGPQPDVSYEVDFFNPATQYETDIMSQGQDVLNAACGMGLEVERR